MDNTMSSLDPGVPSYDCPYCGALIRPNPNMRDVNVGFVKGCMYCRLALSFFVQAAVRKNSHVFDANVT